MEEQYTGNKGFYSAVSVDKDNLYAIKNFFKNVTGTSLPDNAEDDISLHCTIMFSKVALAISPENAYEMMEHRKDIPIEVVLKEFQYWDGHDNRGYLVMMLGHASELEQRHQSWKWAGAKPTFPDYTPHVSLAQKEEAQALKGFVEQLNKRLALIPPLRIRLTDEVINDLKD